MLEELLVLPSELEGVLLYSPMSLIVTLDIVNVESVTPEIMTPFFLHSYVKSLGVPPAVHSIVTVLPLVAV